MEDNNVVIRKITKEEKEEQLKAQLEREYQREQLRNAERERAARVKSIYDKQKKKNLIASLINLGLFALAIFVNVLVPMQVLDGTVAMFITGGIVVASVIVLKVLTGKKKVVPDGESRKTKKAKGKKQ